MAAEHPVHAAAAKLHVELMRVPEPPDRSFVALVRRQLADAHIAARVLVDDLLGARGLPLGDPSDMTPLLEPGER